MSENQEHPSTEQLDSKAAEKIQRNAWSAICSTDCRESVKSAASWLMYRAVEREEKVVEQTCKINASVLTYTKRLTTLTILLTALTAIQIALILMR